VFDHRHINSHVIIWYNRSHFCRYRSKTCKLSCVDRCVCAITCISAADCLIKVVQCINIKSTGWLVTQNVTLCCDCKLTSVTVKILTSRHLQRLHCRQQCIKCFNVGIFNFNQDCNMQRQAPVPEIDYVIGNTRALEKPFGKNVVVIWQSSGTAGANVYVSVSDLCLIANDSVCFSDVHRCSIFLYCILLI